MTIDNRIFEHPSVKKSMAGIDERFKRSDGDTVLCLYLRMPWEFGNEPTLFSSDEQVQGCVAIYDAIDGRLIT